MNLAASKSRPYRVGVGLGVLTAFLTVWGAVVHDDGNGVGFFLVILAAVVGAIAAWFHSAGMARAMLGVAVMQVLYGMAIATAPMTAQTPHGPLKVMIFCGFLASLWLASAGCFRVATRRELD